MVYDGEGSHPEGNDRYEKRELAQHSSPVTTWSVGRSGG
jgi:hypothetical protein